LRLYPPILFLLFAALALAFSWIWPIFFPLPLPLKIFSILVAVLGVCLAVWARLVFLHQDTSVDPYAEADRLVTTGPYRYSRNPMYLSLLLVLIGMGFWLQSLSALLVAPLFFYVINQRHIKPEEERLQRQFGQYYLDYCATTRRWI
jgi:protein-S-isoprenylcysteine O-methyltransferase Ste14